jgi:pimeloyl-ACP methyl ester carboxylesterase
MSWVLLRGLTREARHWGGFAQELAQVTQDTQAPALALDLAGNGEFCREVSPASVGGMLDLARQQLRAKGLAPPYSLVAMSLGGMVAADWARRHPHEVARLVLINTSMRPFSGVTERLRPGSWPRLALLAARWHAAQDAERAIHQLTCRRLTTRDEDVAAWTRIRQGAPVSAANAWRQLWAAARFCAATPPPCPVLVLSSRADGLVHPRCSTRLAQAWQAEHHAHPWAGHDLPHDAAAWVCRRIALWLAGQ